MKPSEILNVLEGIQEPAAIELTAGTVAILVDAIDAMAAKLLKFTFTARRTCRA